MEEIGKKLRESRESIGVSIEEVADDLKVKPSQIEDIEEGKKESFKDVFYLKEFIKEYSKYLGLDYDEMVEEFNEYLFDFTSKISIEDIKKAEKEQIKKENNLKEVKIQSPYTSEKPKQKNVPKLLIIFGIIIVFIIIIYLGILFFKNDGIKKVKNIIQMEEVNYEFA